MLVERRTRDRKVASSNLGRSGGSGGGDFLLQLSVLTLIRCPFHPQRVKDLGHSAKNSGGRLHLNTHTSLTQRSRRGLTMPLPRHNVGTYQGFELTGNTSGNTWPQSSQLAEPLWTDPGIKNGISVREQISPPPKKKKEEEKKRRQGMNDRTFSQNPCKRGKSHQSYD